MHRRNDHKATQAPNRLPPINFPAFPYNKADGLCPESAGAGCMPSCGNRIMRLLSAVFAGIFGISAFAGGVAHAQDQSGAYWVNPALNGTWRTAPAHDQATPEEFALGFTLNGLTGVNGQLEIGRVVLDPTDNTDGLADRTSSAFDFAPVDSTVGEAHIRWNITDRLSFSTSLSRDMADPTLFAGSPVFEDELTGGVSYAITPRFAVSARGSHSISSETNLAEIEEFTGEGAELGAEYQFLPYFTGSVNYTYQSYDGQEGVLRHDESTLSVNLTGRF